ncbi:MAG: YggS family pyridoxal phosphate-dependent enzyme [Vicinamibacterales bacterium]|nr:YggS family pyridoxal phosphate-dependent enzyme [Vicinamibacterales bacterium]
MIESLEAAIAENLAAVRARIAAAAARGGRPAAAVRLVAVSKTFGPEHVLAALAAGQRDFGENRVQEALPKIAACGDAPLQWHLIGHLQSNKARKAVGPFASVQSVDSLALLRRLEAIACEARRSLEVLVQVDLAGEATKFGAAPEEAAAMLDEAAQCTHVRVAGLMLMPPLLEDVERVRPYFRRLREFRDQQAARGIAPAHIAELSMGMSHDFEVAVEEGATIVRVGTAIFGSRSAPA